MRMRKKKHGAERIAACSEILIEDIEQLAKDPQSVFPVSRPLALEIGCGKGDFAVKMAEKHPEYNWIAMERVSDVCCLALEKAMAAKDSRPDNLRFLIGDARNIGEWFPEGSVTRLYLNFSDPWPKKGYAKRRLTHAGFLAIYRRALCEGGMLEFKTDNEGLFLFSLSQFAETGLTVEWQTRDLHASSRAADNVMTEYERAFSEKGQPIYSAWVRFAKPSKIKELVTASRSYRSFDSSVKIPREDLLGFADCARVTPSSINLQMLKLRLVNDDEECDKVLSLTRWAGLLKDIHLPPEGHAPTAYFVICADTSVRENAEIFQKDVGIWAQTILLAAAEAGYGGCMIGNFPKAELSEALRLPANLLPQLVVALGKPDESVILTAPDADGSVAYRREDGVQIVPKRALSDIVVEKEP